MDRESLEVKLDALIDEMRVELAAEQAAAAETKGQMGHAAGLVPPPSLETTDAGIPKIIIERGVDPREELTVHGRHSSDAPVERTQKHETAPRRRHGWMALVAAVLGLLPVWLVMADAKTPPRLARAGISAKLSMHDEAHPAPRVEDAAPAPLPTALEKAERRASPKGEPRTRAAVPRVTPHKTTHPTPKALGAGPRY